MNGFSQIQAFFTVDANDHLRAPCWLFNDKLVKSNWERYPIKIVHPLQVPSDLRGYGVVLEQTGPLEDVIPAALKAGIFLNVACLKAMRIEFRWKMPELKKESGKKKCHKKPDYVNAMLSFFFGESLPDEQRDFMYKALMGQRWDVNGKGGMHSAEILAAFQSLDQKDQPEFVKMAAVAKDEEALKEARAARSDVKAMHATPLHETPRVLSQLLPNGGDDFQCRFNRHPQLKRYQVYLHDLETGALTIL